MDRPSSGAPSPTDLPHGTNTPLLGHNAESLGRDPTDVDMASSPSCDPSLSCTESVLKDSPEPKQALPDSLTASSAHHTRVSLEKTQKSGSASKKGHHSSGGASGHHKPMQATKVSVQRQWVPRQAVQKSEVPSIEEVDDLGTRRFKECAEPSSSSSSSSSSLSTSSSSSVEVCQSQDPHEIQKSEEYLVVMPSSSATETLEQPMVPAPHNEDPLPQEHALSDVSQVAEEKEPTLSNPANEDDQITGLERSLSRTSSLSAKAKEFVPKSTAASSAGPLVPTATHGQPVVPPLIMPHRPGLGILSPFPPMSPLPSPHFGGFPLPMAGPPPPPIPVSPMGTMPLLGPPHAGLLNVQIPGPPPPPIIPSPTHVTHIPPPSLSPLPQVLILPDPLANQPVKGNLETVEDQHQPQDSDVAMAQIAASKPVLTEELKAKIVKQAEFYLSDANLSKDYQLMKVVRKDSEGFVPIALVANSRKVRNLMKNHALVAVALRSSNQLVVSEDGKKVRRLHPVPHVELEEVQSRTVVAENLPADHSIEALERLFGSVGNVKLVRVCEPEASNGPNQTSAKPARADMVVSNKLHAMVEYETVEQAERAVSELTDRGDWRSGLHVCLFPRRTNKHSLSKSHRGNEGGTDWGGIQEDGGSSVSDNAVEKLGEEGSMLERSEDVQGSDITHSDASSKRGRGRGQGPGRGRGRGRGQYHSNSGRGHPVGTPPQVSSLTNIEAKLPLGPRMPDGTRGFTLGRGKGMAMNPA